MAKKILTLNIGASAVQLAEYETSGRSVTLLNYGTAQLAAPLDSGDPQTILVPALLEIVREKGIHPGKVMLSVSGQMVFPRFAAITSPGGDNFEKLVRYEIEQNVPFPIDEMICDRQILGETESGDTSVMIVAAKTDQVEALTDALAAAGFQPEAVGVAPFAEMNVLRAAVPDDGSCVVLLDIGAKATSLVIAEGEKLYTRSIPVAGNAITKEICQILGSTTEAAEAFKRDFAYVSLGGVTEDADETLDSVSKGCRAVMTRLHAEVSRSINFYRSQQGGGAPTKLYLTGGTSVMPQLPEFFQESLGIEVEYLDTFSVVGVSADVNREQLTADAATLAPTAGLAIQYAGLGTINLNLIPQSLLDRKAEIAKIPFVAAASAALVAAAGIWLFAEMGKTAAVEEHLAPVQSRAQEARRTKDACEKAVKDFDLAKADAAKLAAQLARRDAALRHVQIVRDALDPKLWISSWNETVEVRTIVDKPAVGRMKAKTHEERRKITKVAFRCWSDEKAAVIEAERARRQEANDTTPVPNSPLEIVKYRLNSTGRCKCEADKTNGQMTFGQGDCLLQYQLEIEFNDNERREAEGK